MGGNHQQMANFDGIRRETKLYVCFCKLCTALDMLILLLLQFYYDYESERNTASSSFNCSSILHLLNLHFLAYLQQLFCVLL